ncbi:preprotein translocase subunit YajC [Streptosporangium sp. KLBMP 9127]|nr:preprotein translocase subunit YajC [Streptosporangium sp. KLBMP 9127]
MGGNNALTSFLPLVLLVVVFYFLLIRPQRKRQQEQVRMQSSLAPGTRVMTTTGLFATVVAVDGDEVVLEIAPGVESRWTKAAIGRVVTPVADTQDADEAKGEEEDEPADGKENGDDKGSTTKQS